MFHVKRISVKAIVYLTIAAMLASLLPPLKAHAAGNEIVVAASADAYVRNGASSELNFGSASNMNVKRDGTPDFEREVYMRFGIDAVQGPVEQAMLQVYAQIIDTAGTASRLRIIATQGDWEEDALTWSTRPALGEQLAIADVSDTGQWLNIDITDYVRERVGLGEPAELALVEEPVNQPLNIHLRSKEYVGFEPRIVITGGDVEAAPHNLLASGGFEQAADGAPQGWSVWIAPGSPSSEVTVTSDVYMEGNRSLRISGESTATRVAAGQNVAGISSDKVYELSAWIRTEQVSGGQGAMFRVQFIRTVNGNDDYFQTIMIDGQSGTSDWTKVTERINPPAGTERMHIQAFLWEASGTAWFDDVSLTEHDVPDIPDPDDGLPTGRDIVNLLLDRHPNQAHPRLMAEADDFDDIRLRAQQDPYVIRWYGLLKQRVDTTIDSPLPWYDIPDGYRLLETSRRVLREVQQLGMMYIIEQDDRYLERLWDILNAAGNFPDWNPQHFLDVSEMTNAFALAFDWFYDEWSEEQREFLREAIVEYGLRPALKVYRGEVQGNFGQSGWVTAHNNWNTVVNGGISIGALAVADESEELRLMAEEILGNALRSLQIVLPLFQPDGAGEEGVGYWLYNSQYLVYYLASLETALGTDLGVGDKPGIEGTAYFPIYLEGPGGRFNYGNNGPGTTSTPLFFWFANRYDNPDLAWYQRNLAWSLGGALDILWYDPDNVSEAQDVVLNMDRVFRKVEAGSMRSGWNDSSAVFVGFKGGDNTFNHNHLDLGTFVLDALGVRWAWELAGDDYNLPGYFEADRDRYYRIRPEGQNTIVLNPGLEPGQDPRAAADIVSFESQTGAAFMIADLSEAYAVHAERVQRGMMLTDERRTIWLQDEVSFREPGDYYSFMHTRAQIEISEDGQTAWLREGNRLLVAEIVGASHPAEFQNRPAEPLPTSPDPPGQAVNPFNKLTVFAEGVDDFSVAVKMTPLYEWEQHVPATGALTPLDDWQLPAESAPLTSLNVNGSPLEAFRPDIFTYEMDAGTEAVPSVTAASGVPGADIVIEAPDQLPGTTVVRVSTDGTQYASSVYKIHWKGAAGTRVTASDHDGNLPENTIDRNLETRWSADGAGQWIQYLLDEETVLDHIQIAFFNGHQRATLLDIQLSMDGESWNTVYSGQSSGTTRELETFPFDPELTRYVRIVGHGNTVNSWNSITEVELDGFSKPETPVQFDRIQVSLAQTSLKPGQTTQMTVSAWYSDGTLVPEERYSVRYISSNEAVASVDGSGLATAIDFGNARISAEVLYRGIIRHDGSDVFVDDGALRLPAAQATYVVGGASSDMNFGNPSTLLMKGPQNQSVVREAFLQFDLAALSGNVEKAELFMNAAVRDDGGTETELHIFEVTEHWQQATITWNTKPQRGEKLGDVFVSGTSYQLVSVDITEYIQEKAASGDNASLALIQGLDPDELPLIVNVQAGNSANAPYLKVYLTSDGEEEPEPERSSDASVKQVMLNGQLLPGFDPEQETHNVRVPYGTTEAIWQVELSSDKAGYAWEGDSRLRVGRNDYTLTVTAEDGTVRTYTFEIVRLTQPSPSVPSLTPQVVVCPAEQACERTLYGGMGGSLRLEGLLTITIDQGHSGAVRLSAERLSDEEAAGFAVPSGWQSVSPVVRIAASGAGSSALHVQFESANGDRAAIFRWDEASGEWHAVETQVMEDGRLEGTSDVDGVYAVLAPLDGTGEGDGSGPAEPAIFPDLTGHWAAVEVSRAVEMGFVYGYPDGTFAPDQAISRAEFISLAIRAFNAANPVFGDGGALEAFRDRGEVGDWAVPALSAALAQGWLNGYEDGTLRPGQDITRSELAVLLMRISGWQAAEETAALHGFGDADQISLWARPAFEVLIESGIIAGTPDGQLQPNAVATRAEAVAMILRML